MLFGTLEPLKTLVVVHSLNICKCGMEFSTWMIIVGTWGHLNWTCNEVSFEFEHWYQKRRHFLLNALLLFVKEMTTSRPIHKLVVIKVSNYGGLVLCGSFKKAPYYPLYVGMRLFSETLDLDIWKFPYYVKVEFNNLLIWGVLFKNPFLIPNIYLTPKCWFCDATFFQISFTTSFLLTFKNYLLWIDTSSIGMDAHCPYFEWICTIVWVSFFFPCWKKFTNSPPSKFILWFLSIFFSVLFYPENLLTALKLSSGEALFHYINLPHHFMMTYFHPMYWA
jgi:hypothetical protein